MKSFQKYDRETLRKDFTEDYKKGLSEERSGLGHAACWLPGLGLLWLLPMTAVEAPPSEAAPAVLGQIPAHSLGDT